MGLVLLTSHLVHPGCDCPFHVSASTEPDDDNGGVGFAEILADGVGKVPRLLVRIDDMGLVMVELALLRTDNGVAALGRVRVEEGGHTTKPGSLPDHDELSRRNQVDRVVDVEVVLPPK